MKLYTLAFSIFFLTASTALLAQPPIIAYDNSSSSKKTQKNTQKKIAQVIVCNGTIFYQIG